MKLIAVLLIWAGIGLSVPAVPFPQEFVQPDGQEEGVVLCRSEAVFSSGSYCS